MCDCGNYIWQVKPGPWKCSRCGVSGDTSQPPAPTVLEERPSGDKAEAGTKRKRPTETKSKTTGQKPAAKRKKKPARKKAATTAKGKETSKRGQSKQDSAGKRTGHVGVAKPEAAVAT
jgi:hypothetical protein